MKGKLQGRNFWLNVAGALFSMLVLSFLTFQLFSWYTRHGDTQPVPMLVGRSTEEAQQILDDAGLSLVITDTIFELPDSLDFVSPGHIADQQPIGGREVKEGRKIYVSVRALGPPLAIVPELGNTSLNIAKAELEALGFRIRRVKTTDGSPPKMDRNPPVVEVLYQGKSLKSGATLPKGESLDLVVDPLWDDDGDTLSDVASPFPFGD
jgi:beta-lactam-binding protein with PASTA domain